RTMAMAANQSEPIENYTEKVDAAKATIEADPDFVPDSWNAYRVVPDSVEFWQA
ncbi:MAG: pyridoxamine 5-phosphate oxidase, partial [Glaciihabitans sp.]|nr:pyridoxamine 5-phosphate oxidase [Glaciihabitans sp.]